MAVARESKANERTLTIVRGEDGEGKGREGKGRGDEWAEVSLREEKKKK